MPVPDFRKITEDRHPEWTEHHQWWRWLADSLECGAVYRDAIYGSVLMSDLGIGADREVPLRNLYRHKMEVPDYANGHTEHPDYALRLARTPVPTYMPEAIDAHLAEIYAEDVVRRHESPQLGPMLDDWWSNIDGSETSADEWFPEVVLPYLMALGCLDLAFDRPAVPADETVVSEADVEQLGLRRCLARIVWPWNVLNWELHPESGEYEWVFNLERGGPGSLLKQEDWRYRLWTRTEWTAFDGRGQRVGQGVHPFPRVPQFRAFDRRKPRKAHVGRARYEVIAFIQREAYNKESEIILSNARHSFPPLQAPSSMLDENGGSNIPITPSQILKMGQAHDGTPQGLQYVDVPQGPGDSLRRDQDRIRDMADRAARLIKPAGAEGTDGSTVAQSGLAKRIDERPGKELCKQIARTAYKAEWQAAVYAAEVILGRRLERAELDALEVAYPGDFDLTPPDAWGDLVMDFYMALAKAGELPEVDVPVLQQFARMVVKGRDDEGYEEIDAAIEALVEKRSKLKEQARQALANAGGPGLPIPGQPGQSTPPPPGTAGEDPSTPGTPINQGTDE